MTEGPSLPILRRRDGSPRIVLPLRTWLALSHLVVFALPIAVLMGSGALARDLRDQTRWDLEHQGALLAIVATDLVATARTSTPDADLAAVSEALSERLRQAKAATNSGIRVVGPDGRVVATSGTQLGEDLSSDEQVVAALSGESSAEVRPREPAHLPLNSPSRRADVRLFVTVPIAVDGRILGAMVLSRTPREEVQALYEMLPGPLLLGTALALAATLGGGFWVGFLLTRSLRVVAERTSGIAEGRFEGVAALNHPESSHVEDVAVLAASVRTMSGRLQQRLGYISEFASNVSHEFKTPLATLRGTVELLEDDDGTMPPEQRARFFANAASELDRLQRLVDGLLALARAEEGGDRGLLSIDAVAAEVGARWPGVVVSGTAGQVNGNRGQLESVVDNLVANAHRHGAPPVSVRLSRVDGRAVIEVADAGSGISEANRERVFDRFFTTRRDAGGTGLGLAVVRTIVEAHGGVVTVRTAPGETVFRVAIPAS